MEDKLKIGRLVDETLDGVSAIDQVEAPPFFKEKVLNRMARRDAEEVETSSFLDWLTPKYQAVALICLVALNTVALFSYSKMTEDYSENIENFAEVYGLSETEDDFDINYN